MKYLIIGAGATGCSICAYMARKNKDVTLLARGKQFENIRKNGITMNIADKDIFNVKPSVCCENSYDCKADVIFVCVKGYSINSIIPVIQKFSHKNTIVIPILNIFTTGETLQRSLPGLLVTDGCIYIAASVSDDGSIKMHGDIFRIVFGVRHENEFRTELLQIRNDITDSGITAVLSENIKKDALLKFSYVSAQAACGLFYSVTAGAMQKDGEIRECFASLVGEIDIMASAMGINFGENIVKRNLAILDELLPTSSTSMQRDIEAGKQSEIHGLLYSVAESADALGITLPTYKKIAGYARNTLKL